jgi:hypothetical protein
VSLPGGIHNLCAGTAVHPDEPWIKQIARSVTMEGWGALRDCHHLLHDRDTKFTSSFRAIIASGRVEPLALAVRSPGPECPFGALGEVGKGSACPRCFSSMSAPCGWR